MQTTKPTCLDGARLFLPGWGLVALVLAAGCDVNNPRYFNGMAPLDVGGADPATDVPTGVVTIPFRAPTAGEIADLDRESGALGFAVPWLRESEVAIEVVATVTNLGAKEGVATLLLNGASEFINYDPGAILAGLDPEVAEDVELLPLHQGVPFKVAPGATVRASVREDDMAEVGLDLDAFGRFAANPVAVLINRSAVLPIGLEGLPSGHVVPALFRVALTLSATTHMRAEFTVRVRSDRLAESGDAPFEPMPMDYAPPLEEP